MPIQGLITGTLGYEVKRDFLANSLYVRDVQKFDFEIYSVDFSGFSASQIQSQIQNQFTNLYSGDVNVKLFGVNSSYQYPNDSLRAARYSVSVEVRNGLSLASLNAQQPELSGSYYNGLNASFWSGYGAYLLDFKEEFLFNNNTNGNREFNHSLSFGLKTGFETGASTTAVRKAFSQTIASGIFSQDNTTNLGFVMPSGAISFVADPNQYRNYYSESYDLIKNSYSFSRKREQLPATGANNMYNVVHSINMAENGIVDVSEKASTLGKINFANAKSDLDNFYSGLGAYSSSSAYSRCVGVFNQFYTTGVILQDPQYKNNLPSSFLPLINTPVRLVKTYDAAALQAGFDVSYTNNPQFSGDGTITSQSVEFNISEFYQVEATHSFDYTTNRIANNSSYLTTLLNNTTGRSPLVMSGYYAALYPSIRSIFPSFNLIKFSANAPNIKTKSSAKFTYTNGPNYFVNVNGIVFPIFDYSVEKRMPNDVVNEYKVVNRPSKGNKSVLSYGYQSERGQILIKINAHLGKNSNVFYPDGAGSFMYLDGGTNQLVDFLRAIYKFAGQKFLAQFNYPTEAFNWFISDSNYSIDSEGVLSVNIDYTFTVKKRNYPNFQ